MATTAPLWKFWKTLVMLNLMGREDTMKPCANRIVRCKIRKCIRWRVFLSPLVCSVSGFFFNLPDVSCHHLHKEWRADSSVHRASTTESIMMHRQAAQSLGLPLWNIDSYSVDDGFPFSTHFEIWLTWRNPLFFQTCTHQTLANGSAGTSKF